VADQLEAAFQEPYLRATRLQQELSDQIAKVEHYAAEIEQYKLQLARQEQHYGAEIKEYELQLARQEHHYTAEVEQYKLQIARQQRDYTAEIEEHKKQLARQEHHYTAEVEQYKSQVARQQRHYTAEIEEHKSQFGRQEQHYRERLRRQLRDTKRLSELLDQFANAAARLGNSRRWKLANVGAVIKARLSRGKVSTGYDPLDKIVAAYSRWRASHPEISKLDDEINALQFPDIPRVAPTEPENETIDPPNCDTATCAD
jgi:DNA repair exonuclease SbcCD ATPase subunit